MENVMYLIVHVLDAPSRSRPAPEFTGEVSEETDGANSRRTLKCGGEQSQLARRFRQQARRAALTI
jgi:hypothetical protein